MINAVNKGIPFLLWKQVNLYQKMLKFNYFILKQLRFIAAFSINRI